MEYEYKKIPNDYTYKSKYIESYSDSIEVLVLGSSHSYTGVNPKYFDKNCFNFALLSQSVNYDYFILEKYINQLTNLQYVILPVSYPTLTTILEERPYNSWRKYNYVHYIDSTKKSISNQLHISNYLTISYNPGTLIIKQLVLHWIFNTNNIECHKNGWLELPAISDLDLKTSAMHAAKRHENHSFEFKRNMLYMQNIINLCNQKNTKLILYTPPATNYYINYLNSYKWEIIQEKCYNLAEQYSNVYYINYMNDPRYNNELFRDADHLNEEGTKLLSQDLNAFIGSF